MSKLNNVQVEELIRRFEALPAVEAIALGGSRAAGTADASSDYDLYVYLSDELPAAERRALLKQSCSYLEIDNRYFETEDDCRLPSGAVVEIIYRDLDRFAAQLRLVLEEHHASCGYTTCMWNNLLTCKVLFDRSGRLARLRQACDIPYPEPLRQAIIQTNRELLSGRLPSYDAQLEKAMERQDLVGINHRTAEFLASYFDILFAYNRLTHPGEKRLIECCMHNCAFLPIYFEENLRALLQPANEEQRLDATRRIVRELDLLLAWQP